MTELNKNNLPSFKSVILSTGPFMGMTLEADVTISEIGNSAKVRYRSANDGPWVVVEHLKVGGEYDSKAREQAVRIEFTKRIPTNVSWTKKEGYFVKGSKIALEWNRQLSRFTTLTQEPEKATVKKRKASVKPATTK